MEYLERTLLHLTTENDWISLVEHHLWDYAEDDREDGDAIGVQLGRASCTERVLGDLTCSLFAFFFSSMKLLN